MWFSGRETWVTECGSRLPYINLHPLSHTHIHTHIFTHTLSHTHTHPPSHMITHTHTLSHSHTHTLTHAHSQTITFTAAHKHCSIWKYVSWLIASRTIGTSRKSRNSIIRLGIEAGPKPHVSETHLCLWQVFKDTLYVTFSCADVVAPQTARHTFHFLLLISRLKLPPPLCSPNHFTSHGRTILFAWKLLKSIQFT